MKPQGKGHHRDPRKQVELLRAVLDEITESVAQYGATEGSIDRRWAAAAVGLASGLRKIGWPESQLTEEAEMHLHDALATARATMVAFSTIRYTGAMLGGRTLTAHSRWIMMEFATSIADCLARIRARRLGLSYEDELEHCWSIVYADAMAEGWVIAKAAHERFFQGSKAVEQLLDYLRGVGMQALASRRATCWHLWAVDDDQKVKVAAAKEAADVVVTAIHDAATGLTDVMRRIQTHGEAFQYVMGTAEADGG